MINLTHVINIVAKDLMGTIKSVSRLREALGDSSAKKAGVVIAAVPAANANAASSMMAATGGGGGEEGVGGIQGAGEGVGAEAKVAGDDGDAMPSVAHVRILARHVFNRAEWGAE